MAKNAAEWAARPKFPATHYVDARIYSDPQIFEEEKEKLFKPAWIIACPLNQRSHCILGRGARWTCTRAGFQTATGFHVQLPAWQDRPMTILCRS